MSSETPPQSDDGRQRSRPSSTGRHIRPSSTRSGSERRRTRAKVTRSPRPAGGSRWWRSTPPSGWSVRTGRSRSWTHSRAAGSSSPTTSCGRPAGPPPSSARAARSTPPRSGSCPTCIRATSPSPPSARGPTTRAPATATSWAGRCPGTRPSESLDTLLTGRQVGMFHLVCYLRDGDRVFETYWTNGRGVEAMDNTLWTDGSDRVWTPGAVGGLPAGWPQRDRSTGKRSASGGRPIAQWSRLGAGRSDDLGNRMA